MITANQPIARCACGSIELEVIGSPILGAACYCDDCQEGARIEGKGWFLTFHCFTKHIKVAFLNGASLEPLPPIASKDPNTRYLHIHQDDQIDEDQLAEWIRQASKLPGERMF